MRRAWSVGFIGRNTRWFASSMCSRLVVQCIPSHLHFSKYLSKYLCSKLKHRPNRGGPQRRSQASLASSQAVFFSSLVRDGIPGLEAHATTNLKHKTDAIASALIANASVGNLGTARDASSFLHRPDSGTAIQDGKADSPIRGAVTGLVPALWTASHVRAGRTA
jgi:hypothetical protein